MAINGASRAPRGESTGLVIEHLTKIFSGTVKAIDDVSLTIQPGELVSFLGPSGCGKTTTLNCVAGLEHPDQGVIRVGDFTMTDTARKVSLQPEERGLGLVFQSYALWPHRTVADNVAYALRLRRRPRAEIERRVAEVLEGVGLGTLGARYPSQLSGGQQQRVALARALVYEPPVILLDEPLSNLDARLRVDMRSEIRALQTELGVTALYVTHDQEEALSISDRVMVMAQGRIEQLSTPWELYNQPVTRFVASFVGTSNILPATRAGDS